MGKFILLTSISIVLGLLAAVVSCAPTQKQEFELTTYRAPICLGDEFVFTRSYTECGGFTVDTVKIIDVHPRCVKIRNRAGIEHWTNVNYFKRYIYKVN